MSHVIYTCTKDVLTALDEAAAKEDSTREGVVADAVEAYLGKSKPAKRNPPPAPKPASRKESK